MRRRWARRRDPTLLGQVFAALFWCTLLIVVFVAMLMQLVK